MKAHWKSKLLYKWNVLSCKIVILCSESHGLVYPGNNWVSVLFKKKGEKKQQQICLFSLTIKSCPGGQTI